jgi:hypothetical protein
MAEQMKVSGTGWLCVMRAGKWIPIIKLTDQQLEDLKLYREIEA